MLLLVPETNFNDIIAWARTFGGESISCSKLWQDLIPTHTAHILKRMKSLLWHIWESVEKLRNILSRTLASSSTTLISQQFCLLLFISVFIQYTLYIGA